MSIARGLKQGHEREVRATGVIVTAAVRAISDCEVDHPTRSDVWNEVVDTLQSPAAALRVIECLATQRPIEVSEAAAPYLNEFARTFIAEVIATSNGGALEANAILVAIGLLREQLGPSVAASSPLESVAWERRPGAPRFRISPGIDGTRFLLQVELAGGAEPGDLRASWSVNDEDEFFPLLMPQPSRRTQSWQAKPSACTWPHGDVGLVAHLRLRFVTAEGEHGYHYWFPLERHDKGHWVLQGHLGSGVHSPEPF